MDEIDIVKTLAETESRSKSNTKRLDNVEQKQDNLEKLVGAVEVLAARETRIEKDVGEIKGDIKELNAKPGKRWESIIEKSLLAIITGIIGYILFKLGISS